MNFYAIIIGTEILNGRREDKHFQFLKNELAKYEHELFASFIIKDDRELIKRCLEMIKDDEKSVLFSFGGIGSTPDDLTREIASEVFRGSPVLPHKKFLQDIIDRFSEKAYPHRIHMADLPPQSDLLFNPVNNMSGFSLDNRFFFTPGFPSMAHPMVGEVIKKYFSTSIKKFRKTLLADTSEESLITLMQKLPDNIELSCLPMFIDTKAKVELSLSGIRLEEVEAHFAAFVNELNYKNIYYELT
ncbi:MAG: molybdopterin-biosynthesis enzyme MoeA-like protein [Sulfurimonas sp.]|jgi:molybdopterin-biosynthesis enzyme MoeA-like protein|uniref:competence/damage-inducible protein A n=1 Tax=Sulfurimonas sp. TaxID=2022749 RepID=UPI0039E5E132